MSGLAKILRSQGHRVLGSDLKLKGHDAGNITKDIDVVVYTSAAANPGAPGYIEIERARKLGIKTIRRSELIGELMTQKRGIAVSGMHGKTTTSAMIAWILEQAGEDPAYLIGMDGEIKVGKYRLVPARWGKGEYFVAEACEYDRSFLDFNPEVGVILNIEIEHLDYFKNLDEIITAFVDFGKTIRRNGVLVANTDDCNVQKVISEVQKIRSDIKIVKVGFGKNNDVCKLPIKLQLPGKHYILDALIAWAVSRSCNIGETKIKQALVEFGGAKRRFEIKGKKDSILVVDDYGHHPTEIKATLAAAKSAYPGRRLVVLFQPHQVHRTKVLFEDFVGAFGDADVLLVADIYKIAGRDEKEEVTSKDLASAIGHRGQKNVFYVRDNEREISWQLEKILRPGDLLLTIGATPIYKMGEKFLQS